MQLDSLTEEQRRKAVAVAIALTANTPLAPQRYERELLTRYQAGELTLAEVEALLAASVYHVAYRSHTGQFPTQDLLHDLLERSQAYNAAHGLTGVLLYSAGQFVQVLEGGEEEVRAVYARIQRDLRHTDMLTLSEGPGPNRRFADWRMAFVAVTPAELDAALGAVVQQRPPHLLVEDPHLRALLDLVGVPLSE
jgi:hypothetical protein